MVRAESRWPTLTIASLHRYFILGAATLNIAGAQQWPGEGARAVSRDTVAAHERPMIVPRAIFAGVESASVDF